MEKRDTYPGADLGILGPYWHTQVMDPSLSFFLTDCIIGIQGQICELDANKMGQPTSKLRIQDWDLQPN